MNTFKAYKDVLQRAVVPVTNDVPACANGGYYKLDSTQFCAGGIKGPIGK